jgi:hypothetical protein
MTYTESAALMQDPDFRGRIKVAVLKYADSILGEANTTPAHNSRLKWAQMAFQSPDAVALSIQSPVVMDAAVQEAGSAIDDAALQGAVETTVNKML